MYLLIAAVDWQLYGIAALYGCLSFVMFYVIRRFPLVCQLFWPFVSVWGIAWVHIGMAIFYPPTRIYFWHFVIIFAAALPGMVLLYYQQMVKLLHIFKVYRVSKRVGFYVYLREWLQDKINDEMVSENPDIYSRYGEPDYHHDLDKIRLN